MGCLVSKRPSDFAAIRITVLIKKFNGIFTIPGMQRKRAAAALSQAGRAGPDQPIRAIQPAGRTRHPQTGCTRQTSDRQTSDVRQSVVRILRGQRSWRTFKLSECSCSIFVSKQRLQYSNRR